MEVLPHLQLSIKPVSAGTSVELPASESPEAHVPVIPSLPIARRMTARFADDGETDTEVVEYWAVEGADGKVHHGHKVHYIHQSPLSHKAHEELIAGSDDGASGGDATVVAKQHNSRSGHKAAAKEEESGPADGAPGSSESPATPANVGDARDEQSTLTPSVLLGGTVATVIQVYLWATVFVTLFKAQSRTPQPAGSEPQPEGAHADAAAFPPAPPSLLVQAEASIAPPSFTGTGFSGNLRGSSAGSVDGEPVERAAPAGIVGESV